MKSPIHRLFAYLSVGTILTLVLRFTVFTSREPFAALSDALFVSGMLLVLISVFLYVCASGFFDRAVYGFFSLRRIFKRESTNAVSFEEFNAERKRLARDRVPALCGILFIAASALLASAY